MSQCIKDAFFTSSLRTLPCKAKQEPLLCETGMLSGMHSHGKFVFLQSDKICYCTLMQWGHNMVNPAFHYSSTSQFRVTTTQTHSTYVCLLHFHFNACKTKCRDFKSDKQWALTLEADSAIQDHAIDKFHRLKHKSAF